MSYEHCLLPRTQLLYQFPRVVIFRASCSSRRFMKYRQVISKVPKGPGPHLFAPAMLPNAFILLTTPWQPHCMKTTFVGETMKKRCLFQVCTVCWLPPIASQALPIDWGASLCPLSRLLRRRAAKGVTLVFRCVFSTQKNAKWIQWEVVKAYVQDWWPAKALWNQHFFVCSGDDLDTHGY